MSDSTKSTSGGIVGVDVGGTFTDVFVFNEVEGSAKVAKVATTRPCLLYTSPSPRD